MLQRLHTFVKWLPFIDKLVIIDLVNLVEIRESVLDQLGQLDHVFHCVGDSSDDNLFLVLSPKLSDSSKVSANSGVSFDSDLVVRDLICLSFDFAVCFGHLLILPI